MRKKKKFKINTEFKIGFVLMASLIGAEVLFTIDNPIMWIVWWCLGAYFMFNSFLPHR
jgi:hypothetical protein